MMRAGRGRGLLHGARAVRVGHGNTRALTMGHGNTRAPTITRPWA